MSVNFGDAGRGPGDMTGLEFEAWQKDARSPAALPPVERRRHVWGPSRVGHGETQCVHCLCTNREAWILGEFCINA